MRCLRCAIRTAAFAASTPSSKLQRAGGMAMNAHRAAELFPLTERGIALRHTREGTQRLACPECDRGPRDTALSVTIKDDGSAVWLCHRCGIKGEANGNRESFTRPPPKAPVKRAEPQRYETLAPHWRDFWGECAPITADSTAGKYLHGRACMLPPIDGDLRWHPKCWHWPTRQHLPAMVALITDSVTCAPLSLHFTFLKPDGSGKADVERERLLLPKHRKAGGVIRLWADEAVTYSIALAEGIETALSVAHAFTPVWSCIDAGNLAAFPVLAGIESLVIAADADAVGMQAAAYCSARWAKEGRHVAIASPEAGRDWNDEARAA